LRQKPILNVLKGNSARHDFLLKKIWTIYIDIHKRAEVLRLRQSLPLKHEEKRKRRELALGIRNIKHWSEVKDKVIHLRENVHAEVERCVREACEDYEKRH